MVRYLQLVTPASIQTSTPDSPCPDTIGPLICHGPRDRSSVHFAADAPTGPRAPCQRLSRRAPQVHAELPYRHHRRRLRPCKTDHRGARDACAVRHHAVCDGLKLWADMQGREQHHDRRSEVLAPLASAPSTFVRTAHKCTCELTSVG